LVARLDGFTSRAYHGEVDLLPMLEFLSSATSAAPPGTYWHPGDVIWGMFQNTVFDPGREVRLYDSVGFETVNTERFYGKEL
jgi:hypothetical protein